jgi:hypothetical protein
MGKRRQIGGESSDGGEISDEEARPKIVDEAFALSIRMELVFEWLKAIEGRLKNLEGAACCEEQFQCPVVELRSCADLPLVSTPPRIDPHYIRHYIRHCIHYYDSSILWWGSVAPPELSPDSGL